MKSRLVVLALSTFALACGGSGGYGGSTADPTSPPPSGAIVRANTSLAFAPDSLDVTAGSAVTFTFGSVGHNVFFDPIGGAPQPGAPADIPGANANNSVSRTFATAGKYRYTCHIHPTMHGTVVVKAAVAAGG